MCRSTQKGIHAPTSVKLAKVTVVLIFFYFAECAAGSCISYGHACWGGHGKRSNTGSSSPSQVKDPAINLNPFDRKWVMTRLLTNAIDNRLSRPKDFAQPKLQDDVESKQDNFGEDSDIFKSLEEENQDIDESVYPDAVTNRLKLRADKLRLYNILKGSPVKLK